MEWPIKPHKESSGYFSPIMHARNNTEHPFNMTSAKKNEKESSFYLSDCLSTFALPYKCILRRFLKTCRSERNFYTEASRHFFSHCPKYITREGSYETFPQNFTSQFFTNFFFTVVLRNAGG